MSLFDSKEFRLWLRSLHPSFWIRNYKTNKTWDKKLRSMLEKPNFAWCDEYYVKINDYKVWIKNYPFAYLCPTINAIELPFLPTRRTQILFNDMLTEFQVTEFQVTEAVKMSRSEEVNISIASDMQENRANE